jgi:crossover junction endodeoxyribonuclease RuvC
VDPGLGGALALLTGEGDLVEVWDMPVQVKTHGKGREVDPIALGDILREVEALADGRPVRATIERVASMSGQGVKSVFSFGDAFGCVRAAIGVMEIPMQFVLPAAWKKAAGLSGKDKGAARTLATQYWPESREAFARVKDDGRAESALIAKYGIALRGN